MSADPTTPSSHIPPSREADLLWPQLQSVPAFRALLRAVESRFYRGVPLVKPVLDVGCGDGHFAQMTFDEPIDAGIDPWWGPLQLARESNRYDLLLQSMGDELPFPDAHFGSAFSNSVLEHIPDLPPVLKEVARVLQMDGRFLITVPSHLFNEYLGGTNYLRKLGLPGLAARYQKLADRITRHAHTETPQWWAEQLAEAGFAIERWQYYFSPAATRALEWGHVQGVPAAIMRALTGHWILAPWKSSLQRTERWLRPFYEEPFDAEGAYLLIVARKEANSPLPPQLPPARPFTLAELQPPTPDAPPPPTTAAAVTEYTFDEEAAAAILAQSEPTAQRRDRPREMPKFLPPLLLLSSLLMALIGQFQMAGDGVAQAAGLRWFGYSLLPLLLLAWQQSRQHLSFPDWRLASLRTIPRRRYYFFAAIFWSTLAAGIGGGFAILLWGVGIVTAVYALSTSPYPKIPLSRPDRRTLLTAAAFFLIPLLLRLINLGRLPFVLNGIEASLGLDVVRLLNGQFDNPFGTGWLTNPLLPLHLNAIPVRLLGQTTVAMRLVSPFVGAATVTALYLLGRKVWGEMTAVIAATLLTGAHFHLHYSRLGMTNIWDPLLVLLALGSILWLWQRPSDAPYQRGGWLLIGLVAGLGSAGFTSSRLLPIMLATLLIWAYFVDRPTLQRQRAHLGAAFLLALITTLPFLLFYRGNPTLFMERANALGIFANQTNWLATQAAQSGLSEGQILWGQLRTALLSFNITGDLSPAYRPMTPLLSFGPAVLFVLGSLVSLLRLRDMKHAALLIWLLTTILFAGAFLVEVPQSHRLLIATPALALLAAVAMREIAEVAWTAVNPTHPWLKSQFWPFVLLAVLLAANEAAFYYGRFPLQHQYADTNTETAAVLADYMADLEGEWTVYFYAAPMMFADFPIFPFLAPEFRAGDNFVNVLPEDAPPEQVQGSALFVFLPARVDELAEVQGIFPGGRTMRIDGYYASPLYTLYELK